MIGLEDRQSLSQDIGVAYAAGARLRVANEPRFAAVPPARIVPMLADDGVYLASESTFSHALLFQRDFRKSHSS